MNAKNPWGISFKQGLFNMTSDSHLFRTREQLEAEGWQLVGNVFEKAGGRYLPLYEAKMLHHFDHRWATYEPNGETRDAELDEKTQADFTVLPRYWVPESEVEKVLAGKWQRQWLLGFRDICRSTDERTVIAGIVPRMGVGHTSPLIMPTLEDSANFALLVASINAIACDYVARQKIGGTHLTYGYLNQLPVLPSNTYAQPCPWLKSGDGDSTIKHTAEEVENAYSLQNWLLSRVLELTYTAWDLEPFAQDCGYDGPPFRWDEARRFLLRCELDAAFFHLYGIARDDVDYIMETFPIVKRKDESKHGKYRTKRVILETYDALQQAMDTGQPYKTRLTPPPADPRAAHGWVS